MWQKNSQQGKNVYLSSGIPEQEQEISWLRFYGAGSVSALRRSTFHNGICIESLSISIRPFYHIQSFCKVNFNINNNNNNNSSKVYFLNA